MFQGWGRPLEIVLQDGSIVRFKEVSDPSLSTFELLGKVKVLTQVCL